MIPKQAIEEWRADYAAMKRYFIYGKSPEFEDLIQRMEALQQRVRGDLKKDYNI